MNLNLCACLLQLAFWQALSNVTAFFFRTCQVIEIWSDDDDDGWIFMAQGQLGRRAPKKYGVKFQATRAKCSQL